MKALGRFVHNGFCDVLSGVWGRLTGGLLSFICWSFAFWLIVIVE